MTFTEPPQQADTTAREIWLSLDDSELSHEWISAATLEELWLEFSKAQLFIAHCKRNEDDCQEDLELARQLMRQIRTELIEGECWDE